MLREQLAREDGAEVSKAEPRSDHHPLRQSPGLPLPPHPHQGTNHRPPSVGVVIFGVLGMDQKQEQKQRCTINNVSIEVKRGKKYTKDLDSTWVMERL